MKFFEKLRNMMQWFRQAVIQPRDELDRWERAIRFAYDLARYGARQLKQDRAPQMAAALSFRTLFSLLPLLLVGTMIVRAVGGYESFQLRIAEFLSAQGLNDIFITPGDSSGEATVVPSATLADWILGLLAAAQSINLAAITWVGIGVLVYSTISLMVTIENSFNVIYRAPEGRSWARRVPVYWTVLTLGPAALAATVYLGGRFDQMLSDAGGWWSLFQAASALWNFAALWLVMFIVYKLVPNSDVAYRPAMIGAFVAALLIEIGKRSLGLYFTHAVSFGQLYGSLGLIPLFMFWVYLMWLVVLFGLEVSAALQMLGGRRLEEMKQNRNQIGFVDPASVISVVQVIALRFSQGHSSSVAYVAEQTGIPTSTLSAMLDRLQQAGVIHRVESPSGSYSLARAPDDINADDLINLGFELSSLAKGAGAASVVERMRDAQRLLASKLTVASLVKSGETADQATTT